MRPGEGSGGKAGGGALLSVAGLRVAFASRNGEVRAVDTVDLTLYPGDRLALIGESGCGKTVLGMAILRLLPPNAAVDGQIRYGGRDLLSLPQESLREIRGREIAMVAQNSAGALNPVRRIGGQVAEPLLVHRLMSAEAAKTAASRLLSALGFDDPEKACRQYPYEFSGGMRERILIAIALVCNPRLIIADEPTAGLDAQVKLAILKLLEEQVAGDRSLLLITHDLGTAEYLSSQLAVMYAGEIMEIGTTPEVLRHPLHPYTQGLVASLPSAGLHPIPGISPSPGSLPAGCRFAPRCPIATERCAKKHPPLLRCGGLRRVRCLRYA